MLPPSGNWRKHVSTPLITIFVRHSAGFKYAGDEFARRCDCRKHFSWTQNGTQHRVKAGTRSWEEAAAIKRQLRVQLAGRTSETRQEDGARPLQEGIRIFLDQKRYAASRPECSGNTHASWNDSRRVVRIKACSRFKASHANCSRAFAPRGRRFIQAATQEPKSGDVSAAFSVMAPRLNGWIVTPALPKIKVEESRTLPLTSAEYKRLLDAVYGQIADRAQADRVHALFQLMRHRGLPILDALTLEPTRSTRCVKGPLSHRNGPPESRHTSERANSSRSRQRVAQDHQRQ